MLMERARSLYAEIDQYLAIIEKLPLPEKGPSGVHWPDRRWDEADVGTRSTCLNLIHFFPRRQTFPGGRSSWDRPERPTHTMKGVSYGCG